MIGYGEAWLCGSTYGRCGVDAVIRIELVSGLRSGVVAEVWMSAGVGG